jgi:O-antigen/teichoic acid export membrane protein
VISNLAGVCIVYGDRALLVGSVPLEQVPFYNVPLEMLLRVLIVVNGAVTVLFARLARTDDSQMFDRYHAIALTGTAMLLAPLLLLLGAAAPLLLRLWLGDEFALHSTALVRIFLVGILFQALNAIAFAALNAQGRARVPALMHLVELPLYFTALSLAGEQFGLIGFAVVWSVRPIVEYLCFTVLLQGVSAARRVARLLGAGLAAANAIPLLFIAAHGALPSAIVAGLAIAIVTGAWLARNAREPRTVM